MSSLLGLWQNNVHSCSRVFCGSMITRPNPTVVQESLERLQKGGLQEHVVLDVLEHAPKPWPRYIKDEGFFLALVAEHHTPTWAEGKWGKPDQYGQHMRWLVQHQDHLFWIGGSPKVLVPSGSPPPISITLSFFQEYLALLVASAYTSKVAPPYLDLLYECENAGLLHGPHVVWPLS